MAKKKGGLGGLFSRKKKEDPQKKRLADAKARTEAAAWKKAEGRRTRREDVRDEWDKHKLDHVAVLTTAVSMVEIEDWLDENTMGLWEIILQGVGDDLRRKRYQVKFEDRTDMTLFAKEFTGR